MKPVYEDLRFVHIIKIMKSSLKDVRILNSAKGSSIALGEINVYSRDGNEYSNTRVSVWRSEYRVPTFVLEYSALLNMIFLF